MFRAAPRNPDELQSIGGWSGDDQVGPGMHGDDVQFPIYTVSADSSLAGALVPGAVIPGPIKVPLRHYRAKTPFVPRSLLSLSSNGRGFISVGDAIQKKNIEIFNACPKLHDGGIKLSIRILWPKPKSGYSYNDYTKQIRVKGDHDRLYAVANILHKIACEIGTFYEANASLLYDGDPRWRLGDGHVDLNRLVLLGLEQVSKGTIVPILGVLQV